VTGSVRGVPASKRPEDLLHEAAERGRVSFAVRRRRLRSGLRSVLQTAVSAALAWYLAKLVWGHPAPLFAAIAAIIVSSTSLGQQRRLATELALGVAVGILIADLLVGAIGTGGWQIAVLVVLAMSTALLVGGGPQLVTEAGVSAILLATVQVPGGGLSPDRFLDALIGGAVSLLVNAILFPVDPIRMVAGASRPVFLDLGASLDATARGLERGDVEEARAGLERARGLDDEIERLYEAIAIGRDTARLAPARRRAHGQLRVYGDAVHQLDRAVRNVRVLARAAVGYVRDGARAPEAVVIAVRELSDAVRELAGQLEEPERASAARETAWRAARRATALLEAQHADLATNMLIGQVRATAVDLMRGAGMEPTAAERAVDENTAEHQARDAEREAQDAEPENGPIARS
jgi:uncharacterized membrane protein YgaE (UPF0421/DUF939 family)